MPLEIVRNDITKMKVDAIVNAANQSLLGGGGVDGSIHRAAGPGLLAECRTLGGCETGNAKLTGAYNLPCKYVIHAVGPRWRGGSLGEEEKLISCYRTSLELAREHQCETVAFPLISSGIYGYPKDKALKVAVDTVSRFLLENDMMVYIVIFDKASYQIGEELYQDIAAYIDDAYVDENMVPYEVSEDDMFADDGYVDEHMNFHWVRAGGRTFPIKEEDDTEILADSLGGAGNFNRFKDIAAIHAALPEAQSLKEAIRQMDESFSEMLLRKIDEKGMTDVECYKKANIDRKLFSKIRSDCLYKPSKSTVLAFAIALELPLEETKDMLKKAGFALSHSNKFDIIVEFFIERGKYNIFEINEALFAFDQSLLGG